MIRTLWRWTGPVLLAVAVVAVFVFRPDRAMRAGAGMAAHNLCSAAFVSGQAPEATYAELVKPLAGPAGALIRYSIDRPHGAVEARMGLFTHARATYTPGYGCRLDDPRNAPAPAPRPVPPPVVDDGFAPAAAVTPSDPAIAAAIDRVFAETAPGSPKRVKAVVVVKDGRVIAERYAPGIGVDTPLMSYSVAKSFTNALLGVLVRQGRLRMDAGPGAPEWSKPGDPRAAITNADLLRMQSGLDAPETGSGFDPVSTMLYGRTPDMAAFAAAHPRKEPPGKTFEYTSTDTLILDRLIGTTVGGGAKGLRDFAERELFAPAHIGGVTMEFDGAGTFVGSAHLYMPARSFARFGRLLLDDGVANGGSRILPPGWVAWSRTSTLGAPYGAGFWTNDGPSEQAATLVSRGFPKDGFFASGNLGQRIYVAPSARLVVARFGYSTPPRFGIRDDVALIAAAIAATRAR